MTTGHERAAGTSGHRADDGSPAATSADPSQRPPRKHTGRRRNAAARDAILDATMDLLRGQGAQAVTIDAIAEAAGVGRQTIYRWWPGKGAMVAEALARRGQAIAPVRDTGSFAGDLGAFVADSFAGLRDYGTLRALRELGAAAQQDENVAGVIAEFTAQRRAALRGLLARGQRDGDISAQADLDMLVDMMYGVLWYRVMISRAPLDEPAARALTAHLLAAGRAS